MIIPSLVNRVSTTPISASEAATRQQLTQDDFLKLLTTQLSNQDPLKPMEDTQFIAQIAQFSSLQQSTTLTKDFEAFSSAQQISSAQNLLGKTVTISSDGTITTGPVSEIRIQNGAAAIVVGTKTYNPASVTNIVNTPAS